MNKKTKRFIIVPAVIAAVLLAVLGFIYLPDTLVMQVAASGAAGTKLPKPAGLAIPFLMCTVFPILFYLNDKKKNYLFIAAVGFVVYALEFVVNL